MKNMIALLVLVSCVCINTYVLEIREENLAFDNRKALSFCKAQGDRSRAAFSSPLIEPLTGPETLPSGNCL